MYTPCKGDAVATFAYWQVSIGGQVNRRHCLPPAHRAAPDAEPVGIYAEPVGIYAEPVEIYAERVEAESNRAELKGEAFAKISSVVALQARSDKRKSESLGGKSNRVETKSNRVEVKSNRAETERLYAIRFFVYTQRYRFVGFSLSHFLCCVVCGACVVSDAYSPFWLKGDLFGSVRSKMP
jgi:hypothetical protein